MRFLFPRAEEEIKRLRLSIEPENAYSQVGFKYGLQQEEYDPSVPTADDEDDIHVENSMDEKPFVAPASLAVPQEMELVCGCSDKIELNAEITKARWTF